jgi:hypothetical protein
MIATTLTLKQDTLYVAYAPEFNVGAWGTCQDEALNNLADEIHARQTAEQRTISRKPQMSHIAFTASVVRKDKGTYVAHADELSIKAGPASTQRGAIKKLKSAALVHLRKAAEAGTLTDLLDDAGYTSAWVTFDGKIPLQPHIYNSDTVSVRLTDQLLRLNRAKRRATGDERKRDAA